MCLRVRQQCRCWEALGVAAVVAFTPLEREGTRQPHPAPEGLHVSLSRKLRRALGRRGVLVFPVAGIVFAWHLLDLEEG